ncbi:MAG: hypothetical protein HW380_3748 [Magnetococcales bacterium]|nr:hypothetical protein [Magnetococcales bacterium]
MNVGNEEEDRKAFRTALNQGRETEKEQWFIALINQVMRWFRHHVETCASNPSYPWELDLLLHRLPEDSAIGASLTLKNIPYEPNDFNGLVAQSALNESPGPQWVLGSALAQVVIDDPKNEKLLAGTWSVARWGSVTAAGFLENLQKKLNAESPLWSSLERLVSDCGKNPHELAPRDQRESLKEAIARWFQKSDPIGIWLNDFHHFELMFHRHDLGMVRAFLEKDARRTLQLLDGLHLPPLIQSALEDALRYEQSDQLLSLLAQAPQLAESHGTAAWVLNRPTIAGTLLELWFQSHALKIKNEKDVLGWRTSLPGKADELSATLLGREDGEFLAVHWLTYLVYHDHRFHHPDRFVKKETPPQVVIDRLAKAMAGKGITLANFSGVGPSPVDEAELQEMRETGKRPPDFSGAPLTRMDAFIAACHVHFADDLKRVPDDDYLNHLQQLLYAWDGGLYAFPTAPLPSHRHWMPALLLVNADHPIQAWQSLWFSLGNQRLRRRFRFLNETGSRNDEPSQYVAALGLAASDWLASSEINKPVQADELLACLFDVLFSETVHGPLPSVEWHRVIILIIITRLALRANQSGAESRAGCDGNLTEALYRLGGDDAWLIQVLVTMENNGISPVIIQEILERARIDIQPILVNFCDWADRSKQVRNQALVQGAKRLQNILVVSETATADALYPT